MSVNRELERKVTLIRLSSDKTDLLLADTKLLLKIFEEHLLSIRVGKAYIKVLLVFKYYSLLSTVIQFANEQRSISNLVE